MHPDDAEARELSTISDHLVATRDEILDRVEKLLKAGGRDKEARLLARVALRILPGDPRAAALLAKARSGPETTP